MPSFTRSPIEGALLLLLTAAMVLAGCRDARPPAGPPQIHFPATDSDLGELTADSDDSYVAKFRFENRGLSELHIERLSTSCGCADPHVTASRLAPEEEAALHVRITDRRRKEGRGVVTVYSNDPISPSVQLVFTWRSVAPLGVRPHWIDFGTIRPGESAEEIVELVRHGDAESWEDCRIEEVESYPAGIVYAEWTEDSDEAREISGRRLRIRLVAPQEYGEHQGSVLLKLSQCWEPSLRISLIWRVEDVIAASPSHLFLGFGNPGEVRHGVVVVSSNASRKLEIDAAELVGSGEDSHVIWNRDSENAARFEVAVKLGKRAGLQKTDLRIHCAEPEERTLVVPITAFVADHKANRRESDE